MKPKADAPDWLTVTEVAHLLGTSKRTIFNYCRNGTIKARQFVPGGKWHIPRRVLDGLIKPEEDAGEKRPT